VQDKLDKLGPPWLPMLYTDSPAIRMTLTLETLAALDVSRNDLLEPVLSSDAKRVLEALLTSRGFDITRTVRVVELASGEGFVLTQ
jgi:hypothetical protein